MTQTTTPASSVHMDAIRGVAALVVFLAHGRNLFFGNLQTSSPPEAVHAASLARQAIGPADLPRARLPADWTFEDCQKTDSGHAPETLPGQQRPGSHPYARNLPVLWFGSFACGLRKYVKPPP